METLSGRVCRREHRALRCRQRQSHGPIRAKASRARCRLETARLQATVTRNTSRHLILFSSCDMSRHVTHAAAQSVVGSKLFAISQKQRQAERHSKVRRACQLARPGELVGLPWRPYPSRGTWSPCAHRHDQRDTASAPPGPGGACARRDAPAGHPTRITCAPPFCVFASGGTETVRHRERFLRLCKLGMARGSHHRPRPEAAALLDHGYLASLGSGA
jgi:hypothetical protein